MQQKLEEDELSSESLTNILLIVSSLGVIALSILWFFLARRKNNHETVSETISELQPSSGIFIPLVNPIISTPPQLNNPSPPTSTPSRKELKTESIKPQTITDKEIISSSPQRKIIPSSSSQQESSPSGHLLSHHSFLMVCTKCNNLLATFIPSMHEYSFPERFEKHPFTFAVLRGDIDDKRRHVAMMPRMDEKQHSECFVPTLCIPESPYLEQEFTCKKLDEATILQMKDKSKMERDLGKLMRLYCNKCNTKVGSILKDPMQLPVDNNTTLPCNTFMDQEDCSIVEKCHCQPSSDHETINAATTYRKVTLGEWKYSSLSSLLFDMPQNERRDTKTFNNRRRGGFNQSRRGTSMNQRGGFRGRGRGGSKSFRNNNPAQPKVSQPVTTQPKEKKKRANKRKKGAKGLDNEKKIKTEHNTQDK